MWAALPVRYTNRFVDSYSTTAFFGMYISFVFGIHIPLSEITASEIKMSAIHCY